MLRKNRESSKLRDRKYDNFSIQTVISDGLSVEGDLIGKGGLKIDGSVTGNIKMEDGLIVGESGDVKGDVSAENVIVFGKIVGDVVCKTLKVNLCGVVIGNVTAEFMGVDLGGRISGTIEILEQKSPLMLEQKAG